MISGKYSLNGKDLYDVFGFAVSGGSDDLLKFPKRKDPVSHDWPDENGLDVDLDTVYFESKTVSLTGWLLATSYDDFWSKYNLLFAELSKTGTCKLYSEELGRVFYLYYSDCSLFNRLTRLEGTNFIGCQYTLLFIEPIPGITEKELPLADYLGSLILFKDYTLLFKYE